MTGRVRFRPFTGESESHVRLDAAPLAMVLCQVRWPEIGYLQEDISARANSLGGLLKDYPLFSSSPEIVFNVTPQGVTHSESGFVYQWSTPDRSWIVSLGGTFMTLISKDYETFPVFESKLAGVLSKVKQVLEVPLIDRIGVRYVNQISDVDQVSRIGELVRPEILGYQALAPSTSEASLIQALNQASFQVGDSTLQVRSGIIPAGELLDPALETLDGPSWVLDIDAFSQFEMEFDVDSVLAQVSKLSDTAYDFFTWVITQGFIDEFRGKAHDNN